MESASEPGTGRVRGMDGERVRFSGRTTEVAVGARLWRPAADAHSFPRCTLEVRTCRGDHHLWGLDGNMATRTWGGYVSGAYAYDGAKSGHDHLNRPHFRPV